MPHPEVDNQTPFEFAPLFVADEEGRPIVSTIVKATFDVSPRGALTPSLEQTPVNFTGEAYGEPGKNSYRFEPETAFVKVSTDCVLLGHAVAARPTSHMEVTFGVGPLRKTVRVTGDRLFEDGLLRPQMSVPALFERMPLVYERAFGGWDRSSENEADHACEPRNPVGVGFVAKRGKFVPGSPVPNIEDPRKPLGSYGDVCPPAGFGFVSPDWHPRAKLAGTYDDAWAQGRSPLLPKDFDRRFLQAASDGLVAPGYLRGDEPVVVTGATPEGHWEFRLPGTQPPICRIALKVGGDCLLTTNLDTIVVDADVRRVILLWRSHTPLPSGPHDVSAFRITCAGFGRPFESGAPPLSIRSPIAV